MINYLVLDKNNFSAYSQNDFLAWSKMANRGHNNRSRGNKRGGRSSQTSRIQPENVSSIKDRLGYIPTYTRAQDRNQKANKYKREYRQNVITTSLATLPPEAKVKALAKEFIKSYYEIFDQQGRPNLHTKYNPDALFTFSTTQEMPPPTEWGRNLWRIAREKRDTFLIRNNAKASLTHIAEQFALFPLTKHMIQNFTYDIPFYLANPMYITSLHIVITGVYEDLTQLMDPLRAFTRVFILKQVGVKDDGEPNYQIFNDLFMLQSPTPDQIKKYHAEVQAARKSAGNNQDRTNTSNTPNQSIATYTPNQEEMIGRVMAKTSMNRKGALQLLVENKWEEAVSMQIYEQLQKGGLIPQDFFQQIR